jgi:hypothetical protein
MWCSLLSSAPDRLSACKSSSFACASSDHPCALHVEVKKQCVSIAFKSLQMHCVQLYDVDACENENLDRGAL